jgi:hypothetical protein
MGGRIMASTINSSTSNGIVITPDTSGEIELQANGVTKAKVTANGLQDANGNSITGGMYRNLIINGDMQIAQRGTSATGITTGHASHCVDQWKFLVQVAGTWTLSQDTDVPTGQGFGSSFKLQCTTANSSLSSNSLIQINNFIEGQNLQHLKYGTSSAEKVTASFWIKSNKTGTYVGRLFTPSPTKSAHITFTIDTANTWEKKTLIFNGDTATSLVNSNAEGFRFTIWLAGGSDFTSGTQDGNTWVTYTSANSAPALTVNLADSTSNYLNITGVQLEVGSGASDFEFLPYDVQLARCQRYYTKSYNILTAPSSNTTIGEEYFGLGAARSNGYGLNMIYYNGLTMRTNATVSIYSVAGTSGQISNGDSGVNIGGGSVLYPSDKKFMIQNTTGGTIADGTYISFHWTASAEL